MCDSLSALMRSLSSATKFCWGFFVWVLFYFFFLGGVVLCFKVEKVEDDKNMLKTVFNETLRG